MVGRNEDESHMGLAIVTGMSKDKSTCIKDQSKGWTKMKGKGERASRSCKKTAGLTAHVRKRERQLSREILKAKHGVETSSMNWSLFPGATARLVWQLINTETLLPTLPT